MDNENDQLDTGKSPEIVPSGGLATGRSYITDFAKSLPDTPGVYRMLNKEGDVLYVGKAKRLKRRVMNYIRIENLPVRLQRMVSETRHMEVVHTHTEVEALLLESNLIKKLKPRYNILLRDDKTFPYMYLDTTHDFPRLDKHRGAKKGKGIFYGPFASAGAVNRTMAILQKAFMLRNCTDNNFDNRSRPCLQYHIKRCTAPCVGYVSKEEYKLQIADLKPFLDGKSDTIKARFQDKMHEASEAQDYERAAVYRDRIQAMSQLNIQQDVNVEGIGDADVIACAREGNMSCMQVFFFRGGQNFGNKSYFPRHTEEDDTADILASFLAQFYENKPIPRKVFVSEAVNDQTLLVDALSERSHKNGGTRVDIVVPQRGAGKRVVDFAMQNAKSALSRKQAVSMKDRRCLDDMVKLFEMGRFPERIEVYDNSHVSGTNMVGGMIVSTPEGFQKSSYRLFNIKSADASDDYGMMREVMQRRFRNVTPDNVPKGTVFPDLLLIDGGRGQLSAVREVLQSLGIWDDLYVVAISKGPDRNAGREEFHIEGRDTFVLPHNNGTLHYLQNLRDEAHRFAIGSHRARRGKAAIVSSLDSIEGIGAKKKKALLHYFGSVDAVKNAGVEDLKNVEGISSKIAEKIYYSFHEDI